MLLRFRFSNYRSFRDEQELSLVASPFSEMPASVIESPAVPDGILPVAAIYGANASGKSNVLKALALVQKAVRESFSWPPQGGVPYEPFGLDKVSRSKPSRFELDYLVEGVRYQYGFAIDNQSVIEEWLHVFAHGRKQRWFHRQSGRPIAFGRAMPGENNLIAGMTRPNCLFLSAAAQANHKLLTPVHRSLAERIFSVADAEVRIVLRVLAAGAKAHPAILDEFSRMLAKADLGLKSIRLRRESAGSTTMPTFEFMHHGTDHPFSENQESEGTLAYLALLGCAEAAKTLGLATLVDELDRSLHPALARSYVESFMKRQTNPRGAQLIFNTHDTNLLTGSLLRRDQIWFTEKDRTGASQLYPLTDFQPRKGENLENGYLVGRYGAIPFINSQEFFPAAETPGNQNAKAKKTRSR